MAVGGWVVVYTGCPPKRVRGWMQAGVWGVVRGRPPAHLPCPCPGARAAKHQAGGAAGGLWALSHAPRGNEWW